MTIPGPSDLDKSGNYFQGDKVWMGPSLGYAMRMANKAQLIITTGTKEVDAGVGIIYVNVAAVVTINLPDVAKWLAQQVQYKANSLETKLSIKDLGYHSSTFNITVTPFGAQTIDLLASFTIAQDGQWLDLIPLNDLSGWIAKW